MDNNQQHTDSTSSNPRKIRKEMQIEMVRRLELRGVRRAEDIRAQLLSMDPPMDVRIRTIYRYKSILVKRGALEIEQKHGAAKTIEEIAFELKQTFEEVSRELWSQYHNQTANPGEKISALKEIRKTAGEMTKTLQSLGLVTSAPIRHQILDSQGNPVDPVGPTSTEILSQEFTAFMKAKYQDPLGSDKQTQVVKNYTPLTS